MGPHSHHGINLSFPPSVSGHVEKSMSKLLVSLALDVPCGQVVEPIIYLFGKTAFSNFLLLSVWIMYFALGKQM